MKSIMKISTDSKQTLFRVKAKYIYCFAFMLLSIQVLAQPPHSFFEKMTVDDGLSSNIVLDILQDSDGYIWMGTSDGLDRFNGYEFYNYLYDMNDSSGISGSIVSELYEDKKGNIWMLFKNNKLNCYNKNSQKFLHYKIPFAQIFDSQQLVNVEQLLVDKYQKIWLLINKGLYLYKPEENKLVSAFKDTSRFNIFHLFQDANHELWLGTDQGFLKYDYKQKQTKIFYAPDGCATFNYPEIPDQSSYYFYKKKANFWMQTQNKVYKFDPASSLFNVAFNLKESDEPVKEILEQKDGSIYFILDGELYFFDIQNQQKYHFPKSTTNSHALSNARVQTIFRDKSGVLWVSQMNSGLNKLDAYQPNFYDLDFNGFSQSTNTALDVTAIYSLSSEKLLIGTREQGVIFLAGQQPPRNVFPVKMNWPIQFFETPANIWLATLGDGVWKTDTTFADFIHYTPANPSNYFPDWAIFEIFTDTSEYLYASSNSGLYKYNKKTQKNEKILLKQLPHEMVLVVRKSGFFPGKLWISGNQGLFLYDLETHEIIPFLSLQEIGIEKIEERIGTLLETNINNQRVLFLGSAGNGLIKYNVDTKSVKIYTLKDGLQNNRISAALRDNSGNLWLSSQNGISCFDPISEEFTNFYSEDGLYSTFFNYKAAHKDKNGKLYFGSTNGLVGFSPENMNENPNTPQVIISDFLLFNEPVKIGKCYQNNVVLSKAISQTDTILLSHKQYDFAFEFTGFFYTQPQKIKYKYILENYDKKWHETSSDLRRVSYNNLPPGEYVFKVIAASPKGKWAANPASIRIIILPAFWQTWWFKMLLVSLILLFIYLLYYLRTLTIKRHNKLLSNQVKDRTQELIIKNEELIHQSEYLQNVNRVLSDHKEEIQMQAKELKRVNEKLHKLLKTKDKFFSIIGHDLQNPFHTITGFTDTILRDLDSMDKTKLRQIAGMIKNSAQNAAILLNNLLIWAKTQTEDTTISIETVELCKLVNSVLEKLQPNAQQKNIKLINRLPSGIMLKVDPNMLRTILRNIISNAVKFSFPQGKVEIYYQKDEYFHSIIVQDQGIGISLSKLKEMRNAIPQDSTSGTTGEQGTGLGLVISHEFVQKLSGKIEIESREGKGSKFLIQLPTEQKDKRHKQNKKAEYESEIKNTKNDTGIEDALAGTETENLPVVLIVDDNLEQRSNMRFYLEQKYTIVEAENGRDAFEQANKVIPDLIVSDVMMPQMNGFGLCKAIKNNALTSHVPVILLTARSMKTDKMQGFESGADDYLTKPFAMDVLAAKIKNIIKAHKKIKEKFSTEIYLKPGNVQISNPDKDLIEKIIEVIEKNIEDPQLNVDTLVKETGVSRAQLYRKIKGLTNESINVFIRNIRLKRAAQLIKQAGRNVSEIAYMVGFKDHSYFTKCFKELFQLSPSEYKEKYNDSTN